MGIVKLRSDPAVFYFRCPCGPSSIRAHHATHIRRCHGNGLLWSGMLWMALFVWRWPWDALRLESGVPSVAADLYRVTSMENRQRMVEGEKWRQKIQTAKKAFCYDRYVCNYTSMRARFARGVGRGATGPWPPALCDCSAPSNRECVNRENVVGGRPPMTKSPSEKSLHVFRRKI